MASVQELHIYPLKSARGIPVQSAQVTPTGLEWDRHWMFVTADGTFTSQRTHPALARIRTELSAGALRLSIADLEPLALPLEARGEPRTVRVWQDHCAALDQGDAAARWASAALGEPIRVARLPVQSSRMAQPRFAGRPDAPVSFSDGFPILVCNRASLDDLNRRLPEPLPVGRFRPNIVLEGLAPWDEDRIAAVHIGEVSLRLVKPCTRCVITATDQFTGEPAANPLPVLRTFRWDAALKGVTFGENAVPVAGVGGRIERGAACTVVYEARP